MKRYLSLLLFLFVLQVQYSTASAQTDELQEVEQEMDEEDASFAEETTSDEELDELLDESDGENVDSDAEDELASDESEEDELADDESEGDDDESSEEIANEDDDEDVDDDFSDFDDDEDEEVAEDTGEESAVESEEIVEEQPDNLDDAVEDIAEPEPEQNFQEPMGTEPATYSLYDDPDYGYEQSLFDIYQKYYSEPLSDDQWQSLLQSAQKEHYDIQEGDNLWDVSKMLFGDGHYWPKVWSLNGKIYNPHLIKSGHRIYFILGDESSAPSFKISESGEMEESDVTDPAGDEVISVSNESASNEEYTDEEDGVVIPPPSIEPRPVVRNLPPSLPEFSFTDEKFYDELGFSYDRRKVYEFKNRINVDYVIRGKKPSGNIRIIDVEMGGQTAAPMQYIYVKSDRSLSVGDQFVSYYNSGFIRPPVNTRGGYALRFSGEVEVVEKLPVKYRNEQVYKAIVKKAVHPLTIGSMLTEGRIRSAVVDLKGRAKNIAGYIIGGKHTANRTYFSINSLIYLSVGSKDNVQVGDIIPVRMNRKKRYGEKGIHYDSELIGLVKVVDVDKTLSTGLVVKTRGELQSGDILGKADAQLVSDSEDLSVEGLEDEEDGDSEGDEDMSEEIADETSDDDDDDFDDDFDDDEEDDSSQELADDLSEEAEGDDFEDSEEVAESEGSAEEDEENDEGDEVEDEWADEDEEE